MSPQYKVGIIGTGRIAKMHATGYDNEPRCEVVALCDIVPERAEELKAKHDFPATVYEDYGEMLEEQDLDIVSVCLWPQLHYPATRAAVQAGARAVHCEKPLAPTWGEALQFRNILDSGNVQLTFNHQRRFLPAYDAARRMLGSGRFGELERVDAFVPANVLDWGTHIMDLLFMFNGEVPAQWVIGQIDARELGKWFDVPFEFIALGMVKFQNGVRAVVHSGDDKEWPWGLRLHCSNGIISVRESHTLRALEFGAPEWKEHEFTAENDGGSDVAITGVVKNICDCLESGKEPALSGKRAINSTEVIFAIYESSRSRARIDLPLQTRDSAFLTMLEEGKIGQAE